VVPESREPGTDTRGSTSSGSNRWLLAGIAALVLVAGGAFLAKGPGTRQIQVQSDPPGAEVWVAGVVLGRTPFSGAVAKEAKVLQIRLAGHRPFEGALPEGMEPMKVHLEPEGTLMTILSEPEGAKVYVDRELVGATPLRDFRLMKPRPTLMLEKEGFISYVGTLEKGKDLGTITLKPQASTEPVRQRRN